MSVPDVPVPGAPDPLEAELLGHRRTKVLDGRIVIKDWAGGIPQENAQIPSVRIRSRWVTQHVSCRSS